MTASLPPEIMAALDANEAPPSEESGLEAIVSEMIESKRLVDELEATLKGAKAQLDDIRKRRLPEKMQELGMVGPSGRGGFTHSSGAKVHLRVEVWANIRKEVAEETYAWLKDNGHGDIIKETVNAQTLRAFAKERIEDGEPLPPGITTTMETVAVLVRPKGGE